MKAFLGASPSNFTALVPVSHASFKTPPASICQSLQFVPDLLMPNYHHSQMSP